MKTKTEETKRDSFFDNYKCILIFLVVLCHFMSPLGKIFGIKFLYRYFYIFHMPAMLFVSGYFMKKSIKDGKLVSNKIFNYILLYLVFQIIYTIINNGKFSLYQSQMGLWYIQVLIIYSLLLPLITRIDNKISILFCILFGLLVGVDSSAGHIASLSRTLVFLPFFMMGYYLSKEQIMKLVKGKKYKLIIGIIGLIILGVLLYFNFYKLSELLDLSTGKVPYKLMKLSNFKGIIYRGLWYIAATLMIVFTMMITPIKKCFLSRIGSRSLQIFLIHLILCVLLRKTEIYNLISLYNEPIAIIISIVIGVIMTYITSLGIFKYPFDYIMKLKFKYLLIQNSE